MPYLNHRLRLLFVVVLGLAMPAWAWTPSHKVETRKGTIFLRPLDGNSVLFSFRPADASGQMLDDSPLWEPDFISRYSGGTVETLKIGQALEFEDGGKLYTFMDPVSGRLTLEVRYPDPGQDLNRSIALEVQGEEKPWQRKMLIRAPFVDHLYGLGEQFPERDLGDTVADWKGKIRHSGVSPDAFKEDPLGVYGNSLTKLAGGNVANALFPVLYMADDQGSDGVLFLDSPVDSQWDFRRAPWTVRFRGNDISGALAWGASSESLREKYLTWTGRSPVPPRKAFGLWVSEYGFENWQELESKAASLKENGFPVDGFVLDLQWFGGIVTDSPDSKMGRVAFDETAFPNPAQKIKELAARGLGLMVIEESYISQNLPEFADLAQRGFLVKSTTGSEPLILDRSTWWGIGSMLDYTNPAVGAYWHGLKRLPLVEMGVLGHWTDLGEPEVFRHKVKKSRGQETYETPLYHGGKTQLEANNLFGFSWAKSIFDGYGADSHRAGPRPFILARTGTSGIQRFGAALWSGDIGANWRSLRSHYVAQSHMSYSGIDYFGSDVGGFYRDGFEGDPGGTEELYTRWFAAACLTDVPIRPHTMNLGNKFETAPDRIGDRESNLKNLRLRYRLIPYLYSASHAAWKKGLPLISPVSMAEGGDPRSGVLKMIGPGLLARLVLEPGSPDVDCDLPAGKWYDFAGGEPLTGGEVTRPSRSSDGLLITPLFARAGAIVPLGSAQSSAPVLDRMEAAVFPGDKPSSFDVVYDDGASEAYRGGEVAVCRVSQTDWRGRYGEITVGAVVGPYASRLPASRDIVLRVAYPGDRLQATVDGEAVECTRSGGYWIVTVPDIPISREVSVAFQ